MFYCIFKFGAIWSTLYLSWLYSAVYAYTSMYEDFISPTMDGSVQDSQGLVTLSGAVTQGEYHDTRVTNNPHPPRPTCLLPNWYRLIVASLASLLQSLPVVFPCFVSAFLTEPSSGLLSSYAIGNNLNESWRYVSVECKVVRQTYLFMLL